MLDGLQLSQSIDFFFYVVAVSFQWGQFAIVTASIDSVKSCTLLLTCASWNQVGPTFLNSFPAWMTALDNLILNCMIEKLFLNR